MSMNKTQVYKKFKNSDVIKAQIGYHTDEERRENLILNLLENNNVSREDIEKDIVEKEDGYHIGNIVCFKNKIKEVELSKIYFNQNDLKHIEAYDNINGNWLLFKTCDNNIVYMEIYTNTDIPNYKYMIEGLMNTELKKESEEGGILSEYLINVRDRVAHLCKVNKYIVQQYIDENYLNVY
jgi:hypothetical protein